MNRIVLIVVMLCLSLSGMAQTNSTNIFFESFGEYDLYGKNFVVLPDNPNISPIDVEFRRYAESVANVLVYRGANWVSDRQDADMIVRFSYDQVPIGSVKVNDPVVGIFLGTGMMLANQAIEDRFVKTIVISAYNPDESQMLWKSRAECVDSTRDWTGLLSVIFFVTGDYIATNVSFEKAVAFPLQDLLFSFFYENDFIKQRTCAYPQITEVSDFVSRKDFEIKFALIMDDCVVFYLRNPYGVLIPKSLRLVVDGQEFLVDKKKLYSYSFSGSDNLLVFHLPTALLNKPFNIIDGARRPKFVWSDIHLCN